MEVHIATKESPEGHLNRIERPKGLLRPLEVVLKASGRLLGLSWTMSDRSLEAGSKELETGGGGVTPPGGRIKRTRFQRSGVGRGVGRASFAGHGPWGAPLSKNIE